MGMWNRTVLSAALCWWTQIAAAIDCTGINALNPQCPSKEALYRRDIFYVGGKYEQNAAASGTIVVDDIYVEKLTPANGGRKGLWPLVMLHGLGPTGANWLNTPDNRKGWASYFVERGYVVYLVDQTSVGRASENDFARYPMGIPSTVETAERVYTIPERSNLYPQSKLHTQWPGAGIPGDPIFDAFFPTILPVSYNWTGIQSSMRLSGCALLSIIGRSIILTHSAGSIPAFLISDNCPQYVAASINLEPGSLPFRDLTGGTISPARPWGLADVPITYSPAVSDPSQIKTVMVGVDTPAKRSCILQAAPARKLPNIAKVPYLALTGQASIFDTYVYCIVDFLKQAGVSADYIRLGDVGVRGNAHFGFEEKNNLQIAQVVQDWIQKRLSGFAASPEGNVTNPVTTA